MPAYDTEVMRLLEKASTDRRPDIVLMSPEADVLRERWSSFLPRSNIVCLPGLPEGIELLTDYLTQVSC